MQSLIKSVQGVLRDKQAQMEMLGLAFVVVLIVLGLLFYIVFQSTGNDKVSSRLIRAHHAYGIALETAMLETTVEGCGFPLSNAIQSCLKNPSLKCGYTPVCDAVHQAIGEMLELSLVDMPYRATLEQSGTILDSTSNGPFLFYTPECDQEADMYAAPSQPISLNPGEVELIIGFCS